MNINPHPELPSATSEPRIRPETTARRPLRSINYQPPIFVASHAKKCPQNQVRVIFEDSAQSFLAPQGATLEQIVACVNELSARHERHAIAVTVKFTDTPAQTPAQGLINSFRQALLAEAPRIRAFAISIARNRDRADDLAQETLAKAWAHQTKYLEGTNLRAWLFTILRNTYFSELRSRRREVSDSNGYYASQLASPASQLPYIQLKDFARAIERLTEAQQQALTLVTIGETYEDAASISNCAVGTIKSRVFRAREILQRQLNG